MLLCESVRPTCVLWYSTVLMEKTFFRLTGRPFSARYMLTLLGEEMFTKSN